jgi:hypothetical protein
MRYILAILLTATVAVAQQSPDPNCQPETYTCDCPLLPKRQECYGTPENWVDDSLCTSADGICDTCDEILAWEPNRCSLQPQPHSCCYTAAPPPPLARPDGQGGHILAPPECQGANHPAINANAPSHCIAWADPNPPTFNGCDYANTPMEELSADCQAQFLENHAPPCVFTDWKTYMMLKNKGNAMDGNGPFNHWRYACQTITDIAVAAKHCVEHGSKWACDIVNAVASKVSN